MPYLRLKPSDFMKLFALMALSSERVVAPNVSLVTRDTPSIHRL